MKALNGTDLKRFIRNYKRENPTDRQLAVMLQSVEYPYNVGSIFRLADGAGISKLILTGITPKPPNPTIEKVARGKTKNVNWIYRSNMGDALQELRALRYDLVALEITDSSHPYHKFEYGPRICLIAGNEDHGVTKQTLDHCDAAVFVPMFGKGRSHNVHTALAIVTYHILMS